jgi:hypothetical protein
MRPLCGMIKDGCLLENARDGLGNSEPGEKREDTKTERGSVTRWGGRCHDLLGTRCDPYGTSTDLIPSILYILFRTNPSQYLMS